jgi:hypothetical protein
MEHSEPTYENQLWHARKLAAESGLEALNNPHAMIGRTCGCGSCFCCAAAQVYREMKPPLRAGLPSTIPAAAIEILCEKAVHSGDGFRQWLYPNLPKSYEVNPDARKAAEAGMLAGQSAQQIADELYRAHS